MSRTIVGIRPTGKLHIGHYFSVIKPAIEEKADVLVARYHAPEGDWEALVDELNKFGIMPQVQELNANLYFKLLNASRFGELSRMTQFKSKEHTPHMFLYPVLMAHDLVGYDRVIVGDDQKQHIEYANVLFKRIGLQSIAGDYRGGRIMDLLDPSIKMSKSNPNGCLFLKDNFEMKLLAANTTPAGIKNLAHIAEQFEIIWDSNNNLKSKYKLINFLEEKFK